MPSRRLALASLLPATALALTGCGGSASGSDTEDAASSVPLGVVDQYSTLAAEVADRGGSITQADWTVNYIVEAAEPWFEEHGSHGQQFREPTSTETHHIEIIPTESSTGRIIPDVPITLAVIDEAGKVVDRRNLDFYYSTFFHYATNFEIPTAGTYTLRATLAAPTFKRHGDPAESPALAEGTTVEFLGVELAR